MKAALTPSRIAALGGLAILLLAALFAGHAPPSVAKEKKKPKTSKAPPESERLFAGLEVPRISIEVSPAQLDDLKRYHWRMGPQQDRQKVRATIREGAAIYTNVSLQLKGAAGSFRPVDDKPAFTLNFDKFADGQKFHGLQKISLNNSVQDPTYITEKLCREMFLKAGVPVPRAAHAIVELNGRELGLYVLLQGWDRQFLKEHFHNSKGRLYDGGFIRDVTDRLPVNTGEDDPEQADRKALVEAARETNLVKRAAALEKVLDLDRFISLMALDVMAWNWDGYTMARNNWRLYHDPERDKMVFMPHGLDQMFWKPDGTILPPMQGLVARSVMEVPALRQRYFDRIRQLRATVFVESYLTNRVREIAVTARSVLARTDPDGLASYDRSVKDLSRLILDRARNLDRQIEIPIEPLKFDQAGVAPIGRWRSKVEFGKPALTQAGGAGFLELASPQGSSIGAFGTSIWLEKGRYKIEGKVKTEAVAPDPGDPRGGAGFRTKTSRPKGYVLGNSDWTQAESAFDVSEPIAEVQLFCELRALEGKAFFDPSSIRIRKLK